jgi:hypothetical protein
MTNKNTIIKYSVIVFSCLAFFYPLFVRVGNTNWEQGDMAAKLFPLFGLAAFALLWLHVVGAGLQWWLKKYVDFEGFVHRTSPLILTLILLHPLLLFITFGFSVKGILLSYGLLYILLAVIGWLLLLTYDIGRAFKAREFFIRHWNKVLILSTIGFFLTFFHSLGIGGDLQHGPLRFVWIFYGVTAFASAFYAYVIKPLSAERN